MVWWIDSINGILIIQSIHAKSALIMTIIYGLFCESLIVAHKGQGSNIQIKSWFETKSIKLENYFPFLI